MNVVDVGVWVRVRDRDMNSCVQNERDREKENLDIVGVHKK